MLRGVKKVLGYKVSSNEGRCGVVHDFLFDDRFWKLSHLVVRISLPQKSLRLFQLSAKTPATAIAEANTLMLKANSSAILSSPSIEANPPVCRQRNQELSKLKTGVTSHSNDQPDFPSSGQLTPVPMNPSSPNPSTPESAKEETRWNPHLRSVREVIGYRIRAQDGRAGVLEDLISDEFDFSIRYLVVRTQRFLLRKRVIATPIEVKGISWDTATVDVSMDRRALRQRHSV